MLCGSFWFVPGSGSTLPPIGMRRAKRKLKELIIMLFLDPEAPGPSTFFSLPFRVFLFILYIMCKGLVVLSRRRGEMHIYLSHLPIF